MELLGFYDQPYQVAVKHPPLRRRTRPVITTGVAHRPAESATSRVSALWETTEVDEAALDWWKPHIVARSKLGGRSVRLSSIGLWATVALVMSALAWYLIGRPAQVAEESLVTLRGEAAALIDTLPPLEALVAAIGNRQAPNLSSSTGVVLEAESAARSVFERAGTLEGEARDMGISAASSVLEATARVNRLLAYRLAAEEALVAPNLPSAPDETDLPSATEAVTAWRAEVETAVAGLPSGVVRPHFEELEAWLGGLDEWQAAYMDGIRQENAAAIQAAIGDLNNQIQDLADSLLAQLEEGGGELVTQIADARATLEALLGD